MGSDGGGDGAAGSYAMAGSRVGVVMIPVFIGDDTQDARERVGWMGLDLCPRLGVS